MEVRPTAARCASIRDCFVVVRGPAPLDSKLAQRPPNRRKSLSSSIEPTHTPYIARGPNMPTSFVVPSPLSTLHKSPPAKPPLQTLAEPQANPPKSQAPKKHAHRHATGSPPSPKMALRPGQQRRSQPIAPICCTSPAAPTPALQLGISGKRCHRLLAGIQGSTLCSPSASARSFVQMGSLEKACFFGSTWLRLVRKRPELLSCCEVERWKRGPD